MIGKQKDSSYLYLRVTAGPHKGETFRLSLTGRSRIGRDSSCEVLLAKDNRISRLHAQVILSDKKVYIKNMSDKNKVYINKNEMEQSQVTKSDVIQMGASELQIIYKEKSTKKKSSKNKNYSSPRKKSKINPVTITIGLLILLLGFKLISPSNTKPKNRNIASVTPKGEVAPVVLLNSNFKKSNKNKNLPAQAQYIKGFRDFKKGQYESGLLHFQQCLALQPQHELCQRYLRLSRKKIQELIQYHMVLGRKYKDQKQYQACSSTFRNVTFLVKDPSKKLFKEATQNYKYCENQLEGNF